MVVFGSRCRGLRISLTWGRCLSALTLRDNGPMTTASYLTPISEWFLLTRTFDACDSYNSGYSHATNISTRSWLPVHMAQMDGWKMETVWTILRSPIKVPVADIWWGWAV
ncbi:hypothetical protein E2542_SST01444 [Spatholobus suberectus]|nr:hypothetical protein E2542_SST01444 [Spatholobus suberectus]